MIAPKSFASKFVIFLSTPDYKTEKCLELLKIVKMHLRPSCVIQAKWERTDHIILETITSFIKYGGF